MLNDYIYYSDEPVVSSSTCQNLISKFEFSMKKREGITGTGKEMTLAHDVKQSTDLFITSEEEFNTENQICRDALFKELKHYQKLLEDRVPVYYTFNENMRYAGFNMQRTNPGQFYHWHCDEDILNKKWARGLTYIIYLNDIIHDGYTEFYDGTKIQPKQGHCLFFPATWTHVHRGYPPKIEPKYIITGWLYYQMIVAVTDPLSQFREGYGDI